MEPDEAMQSETPRSNRQDHPMEEQEAKQPLSKPPSTSNLDGPSAGPKPLHAMADLEAIDLDDEQKDDAIDGAPARENSIQEMIDKYQCYIQNPFAKPKKQASASAEEEEDSQEPNMRFVRAFDHFGSFMRAASFIEDWIKQKKNNPTDFANDFPAVLSRGILIRKILLHLRKDTPSQKDEKGAILNPEVRGVHQLIFTGELYADEDDYNFFFTLNLLEACSMRQYVPVLVVRIALNHLGIMIQNGEVTVKPEH